MKRKERVMDRLENNHGWLQSRRNPGPGEITDVMSRVTQTFIHRRANISLCALH